MWPTLCRVRSYSRPGFPSPATKRSSVEADSPRRKSRTKGPSCRRTRRRRALALGLGVGSALGLALDGLLALERLDLLGLLDLRRRSQRGDDGLGVVQEPHAFRHDEVRDPQAVPDGHLGDVELEAVGHLHGQRLDVYLPEYEREHAALLHARRVADGLDDDLRLDDLVEPDLVQVDVEQSRPHRVELVVLEHGVVRRLLPIEDDVEDRMQAVLARQDSPQLALLDRERMRLVARPVQDSRDHAAGSQTPRDGASSLLARLDVQLDAFTRHSGGLV